MGSRHKGMHDLQEQAINEFYDESDGGEEEGVTKAQFDKVREVVGMDYTSRQIEDAIWNEYYDLQKAIEYLLTVEPLNKKTDAEKQKLLIKQKKNIEKKKAKKEEEKVNEKKVNRKLSTTSAEDNGGEVHKEIKKQEYKSVTPQQLEKWNQKFEKILPKKKVLEAFKSAKKHLNVVIAGHVDSGKSTLVGHLLKKMDLIDRKEARQAEKDAAQHHKESFTLAYSMDSQGLEREKGVTIDIGVRHIETEETVISILDAPGHRDFVPNMMAGAAEADVAILVIDGNTNAFEAGFQVAKTSKEFGGQTIEHIQILKSLGIKDIIVAINKMDMIAYSKKQFKEIKETVFIFLQEVGFKKKNVTFIPTSAFMGNNLIKKDKKNMPWYKGDSFINALQKMNPPKERQIFAPMRFSITSALHGLLGNLNGFILSGRVESGFIEPKKIYMLQPFNLQVKVKKLGFNNKKADYLFAGQLGELTIDISKKNQESLLEMISDGDILCGQSLQVPIFKRFQADLEFFNLPRPLLVGQSVTLHLGKIRRQVNLKKMILLQKNDGEILKNIRIVSDGQRILANIICDEVICAEVYTRIEALGRITLRNQQGCIARGKVKKILG